MSRAPLGFPIKLRMLQKEAFPFSDSIVTFYG